MKKIQYDEQRSITTMTAGEIAEFMRSIPPDTPILATWEGQLKSLRQDYLTWETVGSERALIWDVEWAGVTYDPIKDKSPES